MDKTKLLEWMKAMEALALCAFPIRGSITSLAARNATIAREAFATDANCASLKDQSDAPPEGPPLLQRIAADARADLLREIAERMTADGMGEAITAWLEENFGGDGAFVRSMAHDDPLPPSVRKEVDKIELAAREDERRIIVANLLGRAEDRDKTLTTREGALESSWSRRIAAWIKDNVV